MNGAAYRVKAEHPRRPGQPLRITDKAGALLAVSGETCGHLTNAQLESVIRNGFVELVDAPIRIAGNLDDLRRNLAEGRASVTQPPAATAAEGEG